MTLATAISLFIIARRQARTVAAAAALAWTSYVVTSAYSLPWYDTAGFALVAAAPVAPWLVRLLVGHVSILAIAYLPGQVGFRAPSALSVTLNAVRHGVAPALLAALFIYAFAAALRDHRRKQRLGVTVPTDGG
jgi:hypothetical protein